MRFSELKDKIIVDYQVIRNEENDRIILFLSSGLKVTMYHEQNCCESVYIEDIVGDLDKLLYTPITIADEKVSENEDSYEHQTYTFYTLATKKGYVDIRWFGESNGYYSESVDINIETYNPRNLANYDKIKEHYPEILL